MKKTGKSNAARLLDQQHILYELISYESEESDNIAMHVSETLGIPPESLFKTLVLTGDKGSHLVCIIPANKELNLKKAAKVSGNKKVELVPVKDILSLTGYVRGGCSPIGMKKKFPTYIHGTCLNEDNIHVSAGFPGLQLRIAAKDLIGFCEAQVADLCD